MTSIAQPEAFNSLCRNLHQGLEPGSATELVQFALVGLTAEDTRVVWEFLENELLTGKHTPEELRLWWWTTPATITFSDGDGLLAFLRMLHQTTGSLRYKP